MTSSVVIFNMIFNEPLIFKYVMYRTTQELTQVLVPNTRGRFFIFPLGGVWRCQQRANKSCQVQVPTKKFFTMEHGGNAFMVKAQRTVKGTETTSYFSPTPILRYASVRCRHLRLTVA